MYSVIAPYNVITHCFRLAFYELYRPTHLCKVSDKPKKKYCKGPSKKKYKIKKLNLTSGNS